MSSYAYVGRRPCGHIRAAVVDDPECPEWVGERVAEMVKARLVVERVDSEVVRVQFARCDECDPPPQLTGTPRSQWRQGFRPLVNRIIREGWAEGLRGEKLAAYLRTHPERCSSGPPYHLYQMWRAEVKAMEVLLGVRAEKVVYRRDRGKPAPEEPPEGQARLPL